MNGLRSMPDIPQDGISSSWVIGTILAMLSAVVATLVTMAKFIQGGYATTIVALNLKIEKLEVAVVNNTKRCDELLVEAWKCREDRASLTAQVAHLLNQEKKHE